MAILPKPVVGILKWICALTFWWGAFGVELTPDVENAAGGHGRHDFQNAIARSLETDIVDIWYPRVIDSDHGGFLTNFDWKWEEAERQEKGIVAQARHTWTCARLSQRYPEKKYLREAAIAGAAFIEKRFWDVEHGGFYWLLDTDGSVYQSGNGEIVKQVYGNAFAIYALASVYEVTGEKTALEAAKQGFEWLEKYAHDEDYYGYFNNLTREGVPTWGASEHDYPKGQNTTIHLLEAFTELYKVWPDEQVKLRIEELKDLLLELLIDPRGYLVQFFDETWMPVALKDLPKEDYLKVAFWDHVSFGHDVETAYLLWEADQVMGAEDEARVLEMGKRMLDHTLRCGWDAETGSIADGGFYFEGEKNCEIVRPERTWWAQAELFNALLMFAKLYPDDPQNYLHKAELTWSYLQNFQIDPENGGWYEHGIDRNPECKKWPKSHMWKAAYHNTRSLLNAADWLDE